MSNLIDSDLNPYLKRVLATTLVVLGVAFALYLGWLARGPLLWVCIAGFFAVAINPTVRRIQRYMPKQSIALATLSLLITFILICAAFAWFFLVPLVQQTINLIANIPQLVTKANTALSNTPVAHSINLSQENLTSIAQSSGAQVGAVVTYLAKFLISLLISIINAAIALIVIVSLIFFMTIEGKRWKDISIRLVQPKDRASVSHIGRKAYAIINGYVVGNLIISLLYGFLSSVVLWLCKSPYFLPLGIIVALLDLIPLVGSTIGAALVGIICVLSGQYWAAAVFAIYTIIYVQFENAVLNPMVYSKNVDVSPLVVMVSILLGGAIAGIVGALVAIPVAATLQVVFKEILKDRLKTA